MAARLPGGLKSLVRQWAWILSCLPIWLSAGAAAAEPPATPARTLEIARDLAGDARVLRFRHTPLLVLYSRADCPWCDRARRQFLLPLANEPATAERVLMRQIDVDSDAALIGFDGKTTTHRAFAGAEHATLTPTLMFYGPDGRQIAEPIVGFLLADFYAAHIDQRIDQGLDTLRRGKR